MPRGIRYFSPGDVSGYGHAGIANVRALVNAGIPVQWIPLDWKPDRTHAGPWKLADGRARRLLGQCGESGHLSDLPALIERTSAPIEYDTVIAHAPPEFWPFGFESGKRNIGCLAWETDRTPAHWLPLMRRAHRIVVPSLQNRDALLRSGLDRPIVVVPHIRRHRWCEFSRSDIAAARADLGIPAHHRVFYTIGAWDPRKAMVDLIDAFARAFDANDAVTLLIKTRERGHDAGPMYTTTPTRQLAERATTAAAAKIGRHPERIVLHADEVDGDALDLIHAIGDVYVSLTHGEGWGLGAFEAATLGTPVIMTAWGGHIDFLGHDWPGAVPYRMTSVPLWPPNLPSYFPSQRWAQPDIHAAAAIMRNTFSDPSAAIEGARSIRERVIERFAEPVVVNRWIDALDG